MNKKRLLRTLDKWHLENKFDKIINAILDIPEIDRDYAVINHLARAYNNIGSYKDAIEQLFSVKDKCKGKDPFYHYKLGYAYYYLDKFEEALNEFKLACNLFKNNQNVKDCETYPERGHEIYQEVYQDILFFLNDIELIILQEKVSVNETFT